MTTEPEPGKPPAEPRDQVTDLLRGIIALEARAAGEGGTGALVRYVGDYELLEEIARGGMGVVFRARQASLQRDVALKMILAGELADDEAVERFRSEAQAAARLKHPGIVAVYEVGEHAGQQYFSMELVEGESLAEVIARGPLPGRKAAEYVRKIAAAIHYAHGEGTLHRDLKPSNILIDRTDEPRITDFGLAKRIDDDHRRTVTGAVLGTPSYMPPEQASGNHALVGPRSDVYALGAVLYELVTGRPPFQADTPLRTLQQVLEHEPAAPTVLNPEVPADLEVICLKCLRKRPDRRYGSAQELADDLGRFLRREPIAARPASRIAEASSWLRRNPWTLVAVVCGLVVTLTGVSYWLWAERAYWRQLAAHPEGASGGGTNGLFAHGLFERSASVHIVVLIVLLQVASYVGSDTSSFRRIRSRPLPLLCIAAAGLLGVIWGAGAAKALIDAYVWTGVASFARLIEVYAFAYLGMFILLRTIHAHEVRASGSASDLAVEQEDELYDLLDAGGKSGFRKRFALARERYVDWTGADPHHAELVLRRMWSHLRILHPDRIPPRRRYLPVLAALALILYAIFRG